MTNVLKISSRDELISYIPHTMGFTPAESMVCVPVGGGPVARLDLPDAPEQLEQWLATLTDVYLHRHHPHQVALVAYGEDGRACVDALAALAEALDAVGDGGPDVGPLLWVNGEEWTDLLAGARGAVDPSTRGRIDAEFALRGHMMPAGGRADLDAAMQGDPTAVAEHLPTARARFTDLAAAGRQSEVDWLGARLGRFLSDQEHLSDSDTARVLAVIGEASARDAAMSSMRREDAAAFSAFWQDLVRRAPTEVRDTPATLLALSSYLDGRGAQAWVALDQVSERDGLGDLVATMLEQAVDPREWDRAIASATGSLMQRAALRDTVAQRVRAHEQVEHSAPDVNTADPDKPAPGR